MRSVFLLNSARNGSGAQQNGTSQNAKTRIRSMRKEFSLLDTVTAPPQKGKATATSITVLSHTASGLQVSDAASMDLQLSQGQWLVYHTMHDSHHSCLHVRNQQHEVLLRAHAERLLNCTAAARH
jgi:hypothetical protein